MYRYKHIYFVRVALHLQSANTVCDTVVEETRLEQLNSHNNKIERKKRKKTISDNFLEFADVLGSDNMVEKRIACV